jgi:hypothetical protein
MKKVILALICTGLFLTSCNKNDDGPVKPKEETVTPPKEETVDPPPTVLTGIFRDSEVQGLSFTTATQNGTTNEKGEFSFLEGETITFKLGQLTLGSAVGDTLLTPISLIKTIDATASIESKAVQNMAALLQTLDKDGDHTNGIEITAGVTNAMGISTVDFSMPLESTLADIALNVAQNDGTSLKIIYPGEAAENMASALNIEYTAPPNYTLTHLMPTLKAYFQSFDRGHTPASAVYKNIFDEEGKVLSTSIISRFSGKVFYDFTFTGYAADGQPTSGNYTGYNAASLGGGNFSFPTTNLDIELTYNADSQLATFTELRDGQRFNSNQFTSFDEDNRPLSYFRDLEADDPNITFTITLSFTYEDGLIKTSSRDYFREETSDGYYALDETQRDFTYNYNEYDNIITIDFPRTFEFTSIFNGEENNSLFESVTKETFEYDSSQKLTSITINEQGTNTDGSPYLQDSVKAFDDNELLDSQNFTSPDSETTIDYEAGLQVSYVRFFNGQISFEEEYNSNGSRVSTNYYYDDSTDLYLIETRVFGVDFLISKLTETYYLEGELDAIYTYEYASNGNIINETNEFYWEGEIDVIVNLEYASNGITLSSSIEYYLDGVVDRTSESDYDANGLILTTINKDINGEITSSVNFTRDTFGNITFVEYLNADGSVWYTEEWDYDSNGQLAQLSQYWSDGTIFAIYFYEEGILVRGEFYDANGNLEEVVDYTESGKTRRSSSSKKRQANSYRPALLDWQQSDTPNAIKSRSLQNTSKRVLESKSGKSLRAAQENEILNNQLRTMRRRKIN